MPSHLCAMLGKIEMLKLGPDIHLIRLYIAKGKQIIMLLAMHE